MIVIFFSVLVHEYGHALTAVKFGQRAQIELFGLGGVTHRHGPPLKLWKDFLIVLNGPLAGFLLFLVAFQLLRMLGEQPMTPFIYAIEVLVRVNFFWTIVNLLPIQPLDGGHLLRILLEGVFGFRGVKISLFISVLVSAAISVLFFLIGAFIVGALFFIFTFESYRNWMSVLSVTDQDQNLQLQNRFKEAEEEMHHGNLEVAYQQFRALRDQVKEGVIFMSATENITQILNQFGKHKEAYDVLYPVRKKLSPEGFRLLHQLTFQIGKWEEAISFGNRTFQHYPNYETAVINALCHAILGEAKPAIGWLQTAVNEGLPNLEEILGKREFDHIRDNPQFQSLLDQLRAG